MMENNHVDKYQIIESQRCPSNIQIVPASLNIFINQSELRVRQQNAPKMIH